MTKVVRKTNNKLKDILKNTKNKQVKVGFFEDSKYDDNTPVALVASIHEHGVTVSTKNGVTHIPQRSFMRSTSAEKKQEWAEKAKKISKQLLNGNIDNTQAMDMLGGVVEGDIVKKISTLQNPPLKQSTINRRKSRRSDKKTTGNLTKPLVDEAIMVNAVSHEVSDVT